MIDRRLSVAPMLDWTDRHCRYFHRQLTRHTLLYTEMITTGALLFGDAERHLHYDEAEHPLALQLGGSEPDALARCAKLAEVHGYDEINLNVGCPSDRVQNGAFGACLMATPLLVADCMKAMLDSVSVPVTIKHRIGIDDMESFHELEHFIGTVASSGCRIFIIHARKAWLQGLNPKQNREIPPLQYEFVYRLKQTFPDLEIIINGGIENLDEAILTVDPEVESDQIAALRRWRSERDAAAARINALDDAGYLEVLRPRFGDFLGGCSVAEGADQKRALLDLDAEGIHIGDEHAAVDALDR